MIARQTWHEKCMNIIFSMLVFVVHFMIRRCCLDSFRLLIWAHAIDHLVASRRRCDAYVIFCVTRSTYEECKVTTINIYIFIYSFVRSGVCDCVGYHLIGVTSHTTHRYALHICQFLIICWTYYFFFRFEFIIDATTKMIPKKKR